MYLCLCKAISDSHVRELGRAGVRSAEDLIEVLGLDQPDCCGHCAREIDCFVDLASIEIESGIGRGPSLAMSR
jgi:bacterioferritin-associated ferredoxin